MKMRTRNIIAITVAAVAALSIIFVVVLAVIRVEPLKGIAEGSSGYDIYYSGSRQWGGGDDFDYEIKPSSTSVNRRHDSITMNGIIRMNSFSVFKSWSQFKYRNAPRITDHYGSSHPSINRGGMQDIINGTSAELSKKFSLVFKFDEVKNLTVTDSDGNSYSQDYDTAIVILDETDGAVRDIKVYVYKHANLAGSFGFAGYKDDHVGINLFYPVQIGAVTSEAIDALYDVYDINPAADPKEAADDHVDDDGHDN